MTEENYSTQDEEAVWQAVIRWAILHDAEIVQMDQLDPGPLPPAIRA